MVRSVSFSNFSENYGDRRIIQQAKSESKNPLFEFGAGLESSRGLVIESLEGSSSTISNSWKNEFVNYRAKNMVKYNKVYDYIKKCADDHGNSKADIKAIANMVCKLSDNYGIDPELIAPILGTESGGFVFTPRVMSGRKSYKGVMQVDFTTIETLYAEDYSSKKKYPSKHAEAISYDHMHCKQDQARIDELKKKYKTPQALWEAIQTDVSLGVEVGIMAYKMKLHKHKGDVKAALAEYCGNQYKLPSDSTAIRKYSLPLPSYKRT